MEKEKKIGGSIIMVTIFKIVSQKAYHEPSHLVQSYSFLYEIMPEVLKCEWNISQKQWP